MDRDVILKKFAGYIVILFVLDFLMVTFDLWFYPTDQEILSVGNISLNLLVAGVATVAEYAYIEVVKKNG